jgi:hypothetical protein
MNVADEIVGSCIHGMNLVGCPICEQRAMPDDIHDRLIAGLEQMRTAWSHSWNKHLNDQAKVNTAIDMAIYAVRAKCPWCKDLGSYTRLEPGEPSIGPYEIQTKCVHCNRPALLAEWERQLNGGR